jgi:prefoldin subunit 5
MESKTINAKTFRDMSNIEILQSLDNAISVLENRITKLDNSEIAYICDLLERITKILKNQLTKQ